MKSTSIRLRLALWNTGIFALALLVVLVAVYLAVRTFMLANVDQRLVAIADRYVEFAARRQQERSDTPPPPSNDSGRRPRTVRWLHAYDLHGQMMTREWRPAQVQDPPWDQAAYTRAIRGTPSFSTVKGEEAAMRVYTRPLARDGQRYGVLQLTFSLHEMQVLLDGLTTILLILAPCLLLVAGGGGLFLTSRALHPVRAITHAAEAMSADDLSHRLPEVGGDEFAHLATTINHMLARLEDAFGQLRQSVERERRFTADASHELRTPLTAVMANTSLALRGERTPAQYQESLRAINQASTLMHRVVQDMLLLARSDSGQLPLQPQAVEPEPLLREVAAMMQTEEAPAPVRIQVAPGTGAIWGDRHHLFRLLMNLLENALRYTPAGGEVTLAAQAQGDRVTLTVTDSGEGIGPEHLPHLGERFYRIDAARARQHGGTGLGLAICKSIVTAHQGTMAIDSTPGEGTRVTLTLPKVPEQG